MVIIFANDPPSRDLRGKTPSYALSVATGGVFPASHFQPSESTSSRGENYPPNYLASPESFSAYEKDTPDLFLLTHPPLILLSSPDSMCLCAPHLTFLPPPKKEIPGQSSAKSSALSKREFCLSYILTKNSSCLFFDVDISVTLVVLLCSFDLLDPYSSVTQVEEPHLPSSP